MSKTIILTLSEAECIFVSDSSLERIINNPTQDNLEQLREHFLPVWGRIQNELFQTNED